MSQKPVWTPAAHKHFDVILDACLQTATTPMPAAAAAQSRDKAPAADQAAGAWASKNNDDEGIGDVMLSNGNEEDPQPQPTPVSIKQSTGLALMPDKQVHLVRQGSLPATAASAVPEDNTDRADSGRLLKKGFGMAASPDSAGIFPLDAECSRAEQDAVHPWDAFSDSNDPSDTLPLAGVSAASEGSASEQDGSEKRPFDSFTPAKPPRPGLLHKPDVLCQGQQITAMQNPNGSVKEPIAAPTSAASHDEPRASQSQARQVQTHD